MKNKYTLVIIVLLVIAGVSILVSVSRNAPLDETSLANLPVTQELLARFVYADSKLDPHTQSSSFVWWNDAGYSFLVPSTESILVTSVSESEDFPINIPDTYFSEELKTTKDVFTRRGFTLNEENSSASTTDDRLYDYVQAYKKDNQICTATVNSEKGSYDGGDMKLGYTLTVSCANTLTEAQKEQRPLLDVLELKGKDAVVEIRNRKDSYLEVGFHYRRTGSTAVLKEEKGRYRVLLISQESPSCELIDKEKIPSEVLSSIGEGGCYTKGGSYKEPSS